MAEVLVQAPVVVVVQVLVVLGQTLDQVPVVVVQVLVVQILVVLDRDLVPRGVDLLAQDSEQLVAVLLLLGHDLVPRGVDLLAQNSEQLVTALPLLDHDRLVAPAGSDLLWLGVLVPLGSVPG